MLTTPTASSFTDIAGLARVREAAASNDPGAVEEASTQFEALVIGMMLKSAREATGDGGIFDSQQTQQYLEMMDPQVALDMAHKGGFGLGKWIAESLRERSGKPAPDAAAEAPKSEGIDAELPLRRWSGVTPPMSPAAPAVSFRSRSEERAHETDTLLPTATPEAFVRKLLPHARNAAQRLGVPPELLVAQAALETGWGGGTPVDASGRAANNVFGIKAGRAWAGATVARPTLEYVNGVAERSFEQFRAYPSLSASFEDYANLIESSPRYEAALEHGNDPERFVRAVAAAGYSTDPDYGNKWLRVFGGETLRSALEAAQDSGIGDDIVNSAALTARSD